MKAKVSYDLIKQRIEEMASRADIRAIHRLPRSCDVCEKANKSLRVVILADNSVALLCGWCVKRLDEAEMLLDEKEAIAWAGGENSDE